jgi:diguanylate cyclase (GGDEF)-like protein
MQVTTGNNTAKRHLLFRISCVVGGIIALATFLLIWAYRGMELRDMRDHDKEIHQRLGFALAGPQGSLGALDSASEGNELSYVISRNLFGAAESSARFFCPLSSQLPLAFGGAPYANEKPFSTRLHPGSKADDIFEDRPSGLIHVSTWPTTHKKLGSCRVEIMTNLDAESAQIFSRSYQIAISSAVLEGLLMLSLLWIARRGDERLIESEKEQNAMESELFFLAHYDTLTHLPNRSLFWERLDAAIGRAERLGKAVCLVLVDLRGFSKLNDEEGRTVGDKALVEAARRIQSSARSSDLVCRIGSDEFAVLLEDLDPERAMDAATRLSVALDRHFLESWNGICTTPVRSNSGCSLYPHDGTKSEELLSCAMQASKQAKELNAHLLFFSKEEATPSRV